MAVMEKAGKYYPGEEFTRRARELIERHKINVCYTAPTAIRALSRHGEEWPAKYDLSSLRLLGTVGGPINPEAWQWYHKNIGRGNCTGPHPVHPGASQDTKRKDHAADFTENRRGQDRGSGGCFDPGGGCDQEPYRGEEGGVRISCEKGRRACFSPCGPYYFINP